MRYEFWWCHHSRCFLNIERVSCVCCLVSSIETRKTASLRVWFEDGNSNFLPKELVQNVAHVISKILPKIQTNDIARAFYHKKSTMRSGSTSPLMAKIFVDTYVLIGVDHESCPLPPSMLVVMVERCSDVIGDGNVAIKQKIDNSRMFASRPALHNHSVTTDREIIFKNGSYLCRRHKRQIQQWSWRWRR